MPQTDMLRRYLDAGIAFTQMTRERAEAIIGDLVHAGEVQREQFQERVEDLVERSRRNTEQLVELVRREINQQLSGLGLAPRLPPAPRRTVGRKSSTATAGAKKTAAAPKSSGARKSGPAKKPAKKSSAAKSGGTARKSGPAKKAAKKASGPGRAAGNKKA